MPYDLVECTDDVFWDAWVAASPQGTPFSSSWFLHAVDARVLRMVLYEDGTPVLAGIFFERNGQLLPSPLSSCFYQGLLFAPSPDDAPAHRMVRKHLEWTENFLRQREQQASAISLCLHPSSPDLRGFSWFHYHEPWLGMFQVQLRYTGMVDIRPYPSCGSYLPTVRELRRREFAKSIRLECAIAESLQEDCLVSLFNETFARQGLECSSDQLDFVGKIARKAMENNAGHILHCLDRTGEVVSAVLFLHDAKTSYYLFGGNGKGAASCGAGTRVMIEAFFKGRERGSQFVDLLGINSPGRGDFKTSFNAVPMPYYHVHWERNQSDE